MCRRSASSTRLASTRDSGSDARERDLERKVDRLVPSARSPAGVAADGEGRDPGRGWGRRRLDERALLLDKA